MKFNGGKLGNREPLSQLCMWVNFRQLSREWVLVVLVVSVVPASIINYVLAVVGSSAAMLLW